MYDDENDYNDGVSAPQDASSNHHVYHETKYHKYVGVHLNEAEYDSLLQNNVDYHDNDYDYDPDDDHHHYDQQQMWQRMRNSHDYYYHHQQQQQQQRQEHYYTLPNFSNNIQPTSTFSSRWMSFLEYLTRPSVSLLIAIMAIIFFQYQDSILGWFDYYFPPQVSWTESLVAIFWQSADWFRGNWQRFLEFTRKVIAFTQGNNSYLHRTRIRPMGGASGGGGGPGSSRRSMGNVNLPELEQVNDDNTVQVISSHLQNNNKNKKKNSFIEQDKENAVVVHNNNAMKKNKKKISKQRDPRKRNRNPLEPAFLDDSDYPIGWYVYHSELGVVTKIEADQYDQQQQQQEIEQNKKQEQQEKQKQNPQWKQDPEAKMLLETQSLSSSLSSNQMSCADNIIFSKRVENGDDDEIRLEDESCSITETQTAATSSKTSTGKSHHQASAATTTITSSSSHDDNNTNINNDNDDNNNQIQLHAFTSIAANG